MASIYDKQILSKKDLERITKLGELWQQTDDEAKKAEYHDAAEAIRKSYLYSGGKDGSEYNPIDSSYIGVATASKDYENTLRDSNKAQIENFANLEKQAEKDGNERLRQAYIKNMQQALNLDQNLKANGVTGGASESTKAASDNEYLNLRDDILEDVSDTKNELKNKAAQLSADTEKEIAEFNYQAAVSRADKLAQNEQKKYDRAQDEYQKALDKYDREYQQKQDDYERAHQKELFEYQKAKDAYDREYREKNDKLNREASLAKAYSSSSKKSESTTDKNLEELKKRAWELLDKGVYDESFPELLGFSEDILLGYVENVLAGY